MFKGKLPISRALVLSLTLLVFATATALTMSSRASGNRGGAKARPQSANGATYTPMLRIFVHGDALYPDFVQIKPDIVRLRAENETSGAVALVFERVRPGLQNQAIARVSTANQAKRADQPVELIEGEYEYYDETRPEIRGKLIVTEK